MGDRGKELLAVANYGPKLHDFDMLPIREQSNTDAK